ncbi:unnamed protein product [Cunninghamella echinulata]
MKPVGSSYFTHQRKQSNNNTLHNPNILHHNKNHSPITSSFPSSTTSSKLRGIQINISSDPFQHRIPTYVQRYWHESQFKQYWLVFRIKCQQQYQKLRLWQLLVFIILIILICFFLLFHVGFFSGKQYQDWKHDHKVNSNQIDLLENVYPLSGKGLTTLIIMIPSFLYSTPTSFHHHNSNNDDNNGNHHQQQNNNNKNNIVIDIVSSLCEYDIFNHVMIWKNNDDQELEQFNLSLEELEKLTGCPIEKMSLHHITSNTKGIARYTACSMAATPYCYFQDISYPQRHLRSLYANFLQSPYLIHGESIDALHYVKSQWSWCLWNEDYQLHACHNTPGSGLFLSKEMASAFINLMEVNPLDPIYADMYFSIWYNQPTYLLQGPSSSPSSITSDKISTALPQYNIELTNEEVTHLQKAAIILFNNLRSQNGVFTEIQDSPKIYTERNARSPCFNDRCLFLTNLNSLPTMDLFDYHPEYDMQQFIKLHNDYNDGERFQQYAYSYAVDDQDATFWLSDQVIKKGDYIGLDLLMPMPIILKYRILVDHPYSFRRAIQLQISYDGSTWIELPLEMKCAPTMGLKKKKKKRLLDCQFIISVTGYRFIRLNVLYDLDYQFMVHDFSVDAKVRLDVNGQPLDIELDNSVDILEN